VRPTRPKALLALAVIGLAVSGYLAAFQLGLIDHVWDPVFGSGSEQVLTSAVSRALPVPDALLGAGAYLVDAVLAGAVIARLGQRRVVVTALAVIASLGGVAAIGLVVLQPIVAGTFCSLCLTSAAISVVLAIGALAEARSEAHSDARSEATAHKRRVAGRSPDQLKEVRR
jgi:uncharacterized membrane protein